MLYRNYMYPEVEYDLEMAKSSFESLWWSIHSQESWQANPWVWVVSFKVAHTGRLTEDNKPWRV